MRSCYRGTYPGTNRCCSHFAGQKKKKMSYTHLFMRSIFESFSAPDFKGSVIQVKNKNSCFGIELC